MEHTFIEHLLCDRHWSSAGDRNKTDKNPCALEVYISVGKDIINNILFALLCYNLNIMTDEDQCYGGKKSSRKGGMRRHYNLK